MGKIFGYMLMPYLFITLVMILLIIIYKIIINYLNNKENRQVKGIGYNYFYRDIPCSKDIDLVYWLLYNFSSYDKNKLVDGLIGAYLLKWYKGGSISINKVKKFGFKDNNYSISFKNNYINNNGFEILLYNFLKKASGSNGCLDKNELSKYCGIKKNKYELEYIFKTLLEEVEKGLLSNNRITIKPGKFYILFSINSKIILSNKLIEEYKNLMGLKNFLNDFSNMEDKMHFDIYLWEEYLVFANIFGIADKVKEQFSKIYPDFNKENSLFEVDFSNTLVGRLNTFYKVSKMQLLSIIGMILYVLLILISTIVMGSTITKMLILFGGIIFIIFSLVLVLIGKK